MTSFETVAELLHRSDVRRLRARYVVRHRTDRRLADVARQMASNSSSSFFVGGSSQVPPLSSGVDDVEVHCWVDGASRFRVDDEHGRMIFADSEVFQWSATSRGGGTVSFSPRPPLVPAGLTALAGRSVLTEGALQLCGATSHLGRRAYEVHVTRGPSAPWANGAREPFGADERRLIVDAELGLVLAEDALLAGESIFRHEVTEFELDPVFGSDTFAFTSPGGDDPVIGDAPAKDVIQLDSVSELLGGPRLVPGVRSALESDWQASVLRYRDGREAVETVHRPPGNHRVFVMLTQSTRPPSELTSEAIDVVVAGDVWPQGESAHVLRCGIWASVLVRDMSGFGLPASVGGPSPPLAPVRPDQVDAAEIAAHLVPIPTGPPEFVSVDPDGKPIHEHGGGT